MARRYNLTVPARLSALLLMLCALWSPAAAQQADTPSHTASARELHDRMQLAVGSHFTIAFEGPEQIGLATRALESLDRAYWRVGGTLNSYPANPVPVVLYTTEQFRDITRAPGWAAGAYDGTIRVPMRGALDRPEELDRVLAHEFTHALLRTLAPRGLPTWLNEGVAAALERESIDWATTRVGAAGGPAPLVALTGTFARFDAAQAELAYATSAVAVRTLLDENGGVAVSNLIRDLGAGETFADAFEHRMQQSFVAFSSRLRSAY